MDNIFIERLWRSIKYEEVHLKAYADASEARAGIGSWMNFYNFRRPHQAMNNQMPMAVWRAGMDKIDRRRIPAAIAHLAHTCSELRIASLFAVKIRSDLPKIGACISALALC